MLCAMAALAADLEAVRAAVQAAVGTCNKTWKDSMWSDFIKDVVSFLINEKSANPIHSQVFAPRCNRISKSEGCCTDSSIKT